MRVTGADTFTQIERFFDPEDVGSLLSWQKEEFSLARRITHCSGFPQSTIAQRQSPYNGQGLVPSTQQPTESPMLIGCLTGNGKRIPIDGTYAFHDVGADQPAVIADWVRSAIPWI